MINCYSQFSRSNLFSLTKTCFLPYLPRPAMLFVLSFRLLTGTAYGNSICVDWSLVISDHWWYATHVSFADFRVLNNEQVVSDETDEWHWPWRKVVPKTPRAHLRTVAPVRSRHCSPNTRAMAPVARAPPIGSLVWTDLQIANVSSKEPPLDLSTGWRGGRPMKRQLRWVTQ